MKSEVAGQLSKLLAILPVIVLWTLANVIISSTMAGIVFLQLLTVAGCSKDASMLVAILVAIAVYLFIWFQPRIRSYISARSQ